MFRLEIGLRGKRQRQNLKHSLRNGAASIFIFFSSSKKWETTEGEKYSHENGICGMRLKFYCFSPKLELKTWLTEISNKTFLNEMK